MKVGIKDLNVKMDIGSSGIELDVRDPKGKHLGDLIITKTVLIWCEGKTTRENGKRLTWNKFMKHMNELD